MRSSGLDMECAAKVLGNLRLPGDPTANDALARAAWKAAVGKRVAARTHPLKMVRTTLIVEVEDDVWRRQLFGLRNQIMANIRARIGGGLVEDLEFRVMPPRRQPATAESSAPKAAPLFDEADAIGDPVMRRIYRAARKKALA